MTTSGKIGFSWSIEVFAVRTVRTKFLFKLDVRCAINTGRRFKGRSYVPRRDPIENIMTPRYREYFFGFPVRHRKRTKRTKNQKKLPEWCNKKLVLELDKKHVTYRNKSNLVIKDSVKMADIVITVTNTSHGMGHLYV